MTEVTTTETASIGRTIRRLTPLLILTYIVAILLISGLSQVEEERKVTGPIGEFVSDAP